MAVVSVAGFLLMVAGILGLVWTRALFSLSPLVIAVQAAAVGLMLWARVTFGRRSFHASATPTAGGLVTSGPYGVIRHPIYTSVCLFCWAGVVAHLSPASAGLGALVFAGAVVRIAAEERLLVQQYRDYTAYSARTKRMIPFVF